MAESQELCEVMRATPKWRRHRRYGLGMQVLSETNFLNVELCLRNDRTSTHAMDCMRYRSVNLPAVFFIYCVLQPRL